MQNIGQVQETIHAMKTIAAAMKLKKLGQEDLYNVQMAIEEINTILYHTKKLKFQREYDMSDDKEYFSYMGEVEALTALWEESLCRRHGNKPDREFWEIYEYFRYVDPNTIYQDTVERFLKLPEGMRIEFLSLPYRYSFLEGKIDFTRNDFSLIQQYTEMMVEKVEKYKWLYEHLADNRSKVVLNGLIEYWFTFNLGKLYMLRETAFTAYFDMDILKCTDEEVLVDLGAYTGDSVQDYIDVYETYKRIYAYEVTPSTYRNMVQNLSAYPDIVPIQKGVGSKSCTMCVNDIENNAGTRVQEHGNTAVEVVTLDEDIKEPVTIIKMDIEGAERDAILGAEQHICAEKSRLLVSAYHIPEDIFELPFLINCIRDDYKLYIRFHGGDCIWPCDYVIYAV